MAKTFLTSTMQLISYHSVTFFVYLALGIKLTNSFNSIIYPLNNCHIRFATLI